VESQEFTRNYLLKIPHKPLEIALGVTGIQPIASPEPVLRSTENQLGFYRKSIGESGFFQISWVSGHLWFTGSLKISSSTCPELPEERSFFPSRSLCLSEMPSQSARTKQKIILSFNSQTKSSVNS
jgi:hypothetical protein